MAVFTAIGGAIATSVFGAAAAGTFGYTLLAGVSAAALQAAAGYGLSLIGQSLAGQETDQYSILSKVQAGDNVSRTVPMGYMLTSGSMAYYNSWGPANSFFTQVIALGDVPVRDFGRVIIDGAYVTLLTGDEHADYGYPASQYRKGGIDHLWVKFYDGTQTVADDFLVDDVSSADRPYADTRVGYGIPYAIVTARAPERSDSDEKPLFSGFPKAKFEFDVGMALFDPSDVGQDADIPATWGGVGDLNPAAQLFNVLRGIRYDGEWLAGLQNTTPAMVPTAHWASRIEKAQAAISKPGGGTEPTYRAGLEIRVNEPIRTTVERLLTAMQGRLINVGGIYKLTLGEPDDPVYAFTDAQIETGNNEQSFSPHLSLADTINGIAATFPSPAGGWNDKAAKPLIRTDLEERVGGRRLMASVALNMVPYSAQVQRLMRSALAEAQRERRLTIVLGPEAWSLEPGDYVEWTSERNGFIAKLFRVDGVIYRDNLDVVLDLTEVDPSDYDWNPDTDYTAIVDGPLGLLSPPSVQVGSPNAFPDTIYDNAAQARRPTIRVEYAGGVAGVRSVRVRVRLDAVAHDGTIIYDEPQPYGAPYSLKLPAGVTLPDTDYEVEVLFVMDSASVQSDWCAPIDVTTPDVRLTGADIGDEQLGIEHFLHSLAPPQVVNDLDDAITYDGATAVLTTDGLLYRYTGGVWTNAIPTNVLDGLIVGAQIADAAIIASKLATDAVTAVAIAAGAVGTAELAVGSVTTTIIANNAVQTANINALAVTAAKVANATITATQIANATITGTQIANLAIGTAHIDALAVTAAKVANATITATQIANTTITAAQIVAATITGTQIANTTIAAGNIIAGTITATQIASSTITTTQIAANTILAADIAAGTITTTEIAAGTITASNILSSTITTTQIAANTILAADIAAGTITTTEIAANTIVAADIVAGTITTTEIAANTIVAADIAAGTITTTQIAAGTIVASNISSGTITTTQIAAGTIVASNIATGTITATQIAAATITGAKMVSATITAREIILTDFTNIIPDNQIQSSAAWNPDSTGASVGILAFGGGSLGATGYMYVRSRSPTGFLPAFRSTRFGVVAGQEYYFATSVVRAAGSGTYTYQSQVNWQDSSGGGITNVEIGGSAGSYSDSAIHTKSGEHIAPAGAVQADVRIYVNLTSTTADFDIGGIIGRVKANATLIVDGSIIAAKIGANAVTAGKVDANAITAGTIAAGAINTSALMVDGVVITAKILNNAVTVSGADVETSDTNVTATSGTITLPTAWLTISSFSVTPDGGDILLVACAEVFARSNTSGSDGRVEMAIYRGATQLIVRTRDYDIGVFETADIFMLYKDAGAGTSARTYSLQIRCIAGGAGGTGVCHSCTVQDGAGIIGWNLKK